MQLNCVNYYVSCCLSHWCDNIETLLNVECVEVFVKFVIYNVNFDDNNQLFGGMYFDLMTLFATSDTSLWNIPSINNVYISKWCLAQCVETDVTITNFNKHLTDSTEHAIILSTFESCLLNGTNRR